MDRVKGCGLKHRTTGLVYWQRGAGLKTASVGALAGPGVAPSAGRQSVPAGEA